MSTEGITIYETSFMLHLDTFFLDMRLPFENQKAEKSFWVFGGERGGQGLRMKLLQLQDP